MQLNLSDSTVEMKVTGDATKEAMRMHAKENSSVAPEGGRQ